MPRGNLMFIKQYASFKNIKSPKGGYKTNSSEYLIVLIIPQKIFPDSYNIGLNRSRDAIVFSRVQPIVPVREKYPDG